MDDAFKTLPWPKNSPEDDTAKFFSEKQDIRLLTAESIEDC